MEPLQNYSKLCESCLTCECCNEAAFLTEHDIVNIEKELAIPRADFVVAKEDNGCFANFLRQTNDGSCIFLSKENKKCGIYNVRPLDCQLFPLDIDIQDDKYTWIQYTICRQDYLPAEGLLKVAENKVLPLLKPYLESYSRQEVKMHTLGDWRNLRQCKL